MASGRLRPAHSIAHCVAPIWPAETRCQEGFPETRGGPEAYAGASHPTDSQQRKRGTF